MPSQELHLAQGIGPLDGKVEKSYSISKEKAYESVQRVKELCRQKRGIDIQLSMAIHYVNKSKSWFSSGYTSWPEFLSDPDVSIERRSADRMVCVVDCLIVSLGIEPAKLLHVGISKLYPITEVVRTKEEALHWISIANMNTRDVVEKMVKEEKDKREVLSHPSISDPYTGASFGDGFGDDVGKDKNYVTENSKNGETEEEVVEKNVIKPKMSPSPSSLPSASTSFSKKPIKNSFKDSDKLSEEESKKDLVIESVLYMNISEITLLQGKKQYKVTVRFPGMKDEISSFCDRIVLTQNGIDITKEMVKDTTTKILSLQSSGE